ncbi:DUF1993 family protein [Methylobacterium sp. J-048]|uniref:DUF1993 family protein n=1 Tax=Methylobacterium sp. J-048 TaxID=2836635 RepID=UPI001FBB578E|nr:DUF1993 family protein [Methylobacterium sp. J-048]
MSLFLHGASVPVYTRGPAILPTSLDKAEAHAAVAGADPSSYALARHDPDMPTLVGQVRLSSDTAKGSAARISAIEAPPFAAGEATFDQVRGAASRIGQATEAVPRTAG